MDTETKNCPLCAETIKAVAKVCPHCQSKLVRYARWRQEVGGVCVGLILLGMFLMLMAWVVPDDGLKGRSFSGHQADLRVERMSLKSVGKRGEFQVAGIVTNVGNYPWRIREIQVEFRAQDGQLIEAQHSQITAPFVVQPAQEAAFCLSLFHLRPDVVAAKLEARVQDASDGNLPVDPD